MKVKVSFDPGMLATLAAQSSTLRYVNCRCRAFLMAHWADGCWHIRRFFSQNCTFINRNWLTGGIIRYGHACMQGADPIIQDDLYQGTARSAEGYLADIFFAQAKEEGCVVEVNWQDQDSSSEKSFWCVVWD